MSGLRAPHEFVYPIGRIEFEYQFGASAHSTIMLRTISELFFPNFYTHRQEPGRGGITVRLQSVKNVLTSCTDAKLKLEPILFSSELDSI